MGLDIQATGWLLSRLRPGSLHAICLFVRDSLVNQWILTGSCDPQCFIEIYVCESLHWQS